MWLMQNTSFHLGCLEHCYMFARKYSHDQLLPAKSLSTEFNDHSWQMKFHVSLQFAVELSVYCMASLREDPCKLYLLSSVICFMCAFPFADFTLCVFVGINWKCGCDNFLNSENPSESPNLGVLLGLLTCGYRCQCGHFLFPLQSSHFSQKTCHISMKLQYSESSLVTLGSTEEHLPQL